MKYLYLIILTTSLSCSALAGQWEWHHGERVWVDENSPWADCSARQRSEEYIQEQIEQQEQLSDEINQRLQTLQDSIDQETDQE
jgi:hypothetical protein